MAKEIKENSASKPEKGKKANIFVRAGKRISRWFREMKSELKKVVWPTGKQTLNNVIVAVVVMVLAGVVIWAFDQLAYLIVQSLISIGG
ncbi:MAG: preprotein translocase subunit SecE [Clostridiales bacterium]|nr:preprotein translocase subunit SecE [Clostridiales bacterium]